MNRKMLKLCAGTILVCVLSSTTGVFANTWKKVGYDTSDNAVASGRYACVYQEYDENGIATGNVKAGDEIYSLNLDLKPFAETITWKNAFVDKSHYCAYCGYGNAGDLYFANHDLLPAHDCGNLEYATLVLDGQAQERVTATGAYGKVQYRWTNIFWEKAAPYKIYQKKEANFGNGWYTDATYPTRYSGVNEKVVVNQPQVYIDENSLPMTGDVTGYETLFTGSVLKLYQRTLTGTTMPMTVIDDITYPNNGLFTNGLVAEAKWVDAGYEAAAPYRMYQILSLDGYLMDGGKIKIATNGEPVEITKPYIYRYTGGLAKPVITYTDYMIDVNAYDPATRTAPVVATIVLDGRKTTLAPVKTGEYATIEYNQSYNYDKETKSVVGTFVARVNENGTVVIKKAVVDGVSIPYGAASWGYIPLYTAPQQTNDFRY